MKTFWTQMRQWFFRTLFAEEAATLERYRLHVGEIERWFSSCSPEVAQTATWVRQYSEARLSVGEEASGLSISSLRVKLFGHKPLRKKASREPSTELRFVVNSQADKLELLQALKHIHDANVDTDIPMVNSLCHIYQAPWFIQVRHPGEQLPLLSQE